MSKISVSILGATGLVGQRLIQLLADHPWFEIAALGASERSAGKKYKDAAAWHIPTEMPASIRDFVLQPSDPSAINTPIVFSALPTSVAGATEEAFARAGAIVMSNASSHRMDEDVPLLIPEINPDHIGLIKTQRERRNWSGAIFCKANCSTIHLVLALKPLADAFGLKRMIITTMQAISGAGSRGVASMEILDNVIPYIGGEEQKTETEPLKILGRLSNGAIVPADFKVSSHCNRVATHDGHLETVSVELEKRASLEEVRRVLAEFSGEPQRLNLPSAPKHPIVVRDEPNRPQPRLDREAEHGMATVIGRLRPCNVFDYRFVLLGHNTIRGAAGGNILSAELLVANKFVT
jgi:aspartate-semialdehyde dehydrogenase